MRTWFASVALLLCIALGLLCYLPYPLDTIDPQRGGPLLVTDRNGQLLRSIPAPDGRPGRDKWVKLQDIHSSAILTLLASEDQNFFEHFGVDPYSVVRAIWLNLTTPQTYGASTITMQLIRLIHSQGRPRSLYNKIREGILAFWLEQHLDKRSILEQYLNRVYYGHGAYGIEAAAQTYFSKPASSLSTAEATLLCVIPRGPSRYDPKQHLDRALARRDHLLELLLQQGKLSQQQVQHATFQPVKLTVQEHPFQAAHFVDWVLTEVPAEVLNKGGIVRTTLDLSLQQALEHRVSEHVEALRDRGVQQAGCVILDSMTGQVLAMVGSQDYGQDAGQLNIATWRRFPGSALKPFVYAAAIEAGDHPGTIAYDVIDVPSRYRVQGGLPRERGPVRYREALAGSYNLAAVHVLERVGVQRVMEKLQEAHVSEVVQDPDDYGLRLALGSTKVRLVDLATGYGFLVRQGRVGSPRPIQVVEYADGSRWWPTYSREHQLFSPQVSWIVMDMLSDPEARRPMFGNELPADMPFPIVVKTGTAQGFSDTLAIFATREYTVAAWTGRFDGKSTQGLLGMNGSGPLARAGLLLASRGRFLTLPTRPQGVVSGVICPLSGLYPSPDCPHRKKEYFIEGHEEKRTCDWHVRHKGRVEVRYPDVVQAWTRRYKNIAGRQIAAASRPNVVAIVDSE